MSVSLVAAACVVAGILLAGLAMVLARAASFEPPPAPSPALLPPTPRRSGLDRDDLEGISTVLRRWAAAQRALRGAVAAIDEAEATGEWPGWGWRVRLDPGARQALDRALNSLDRNPTTSKET